MVSTNHFGIGCPPDCFEVLEQGFTVMLHANITPSTFYNASKPSENRTSLATTQDENSEVLPSGAVAVAVTK